MSETTIRHGIAWRAHLADRYGAGYSPAYDYGQPAGPRTEDELAERDAFRLRELTAARDIAARALAAGTVPVALRAKLAERIARTDVEIAAAQARAWPIVTSPPPF
jgi:hypothetical protein